MCELFIYNEIVHGVQTNDRKDKLRIIIHFLVFQIIHSLVLLIHKQISKVAHNINMPNISSNLQNCLFLLLHIF